jgi:hypothetical protein
MAPEAWIKIPGPSETCPVTGITGANLIALVEESCAGNSKCRVRWKKDADRNIMIEEESLWRHLN